MAKPENNLTSVPTDSLPIIVQLSNDILICFSNRSNKVETAFKQVVFCFTHTGSTAFPYCIKLFVL